MASIYAGTEQAYGLIANISQAGACLASGIAFKAGSKVLLRIGFDPEGEPFTTEARVVWSREGTENKQNPTYYHGVEFNLSTDEQGKELHLILSRPDFEAPIIPGIEPPKPA
jgi:hypothetical protein